MNSKPVYNWLGPIACMSDDDWMRLWVFWTMASRGRIRIYSKVYLVKYAKFRGVARVRN